MQRLGLPMRLRVLLDALQTKQNALQVLLQVQVAAVVVVVAVVMRAANGLMLTGELSQGK